jgi:ribosome-associated heat shock protein Hsp15
MRVDKWLWHARFFKTRTLATQLAAAGNIRINGQKQSRAAATIRAGDVLTFPLNQNVRVIEVVALSTRRGPAVEAQALYIDRDPPQPKKRAAMRIALPARAVSDNHPPDKPRPSCDQNNHCKLFAKRLDSPPCWIK